MLNTRKRSWKTLDGAVVETRPCPTNSTGRIQAKGVGESSQQPQGVLESRLPLSPEELSDTGGFAERTEANLPDNDIGVSFDAQFDQGGQLDQQHNGHFEPFGAGFEPPPSFIYPSNPCPTQTLTDTDPLSLRDSESPVLDFSQVQYDQIFQPDTASSFNMPYTTALDYNWLFNNSEDVLAQGFGVTSSHQYATGFNPRVGRAQAPSAPQSAFAITTPKSMDSFDHTEQPPNPPVSDMEPSRPPELEARLGTPQSRTSLGSTYSTRASYRPSPKQRASRDIEVETRSPPRLSQEMEMPLSSIEKPDVPTIDEGTRQKLLHVIETANPHVPGMHFPIREHSLLSAQSLASYLELYFTHFNTAYPLIHVATFEPREVEPLLLLSVLLLGATYSDKDSHQLAVCIHDVIRPSIFAHAGFSPKPELWTLQAILLVECFGKSRAGQLQHDMSHLFHGLLINLIRRSDCQSVQPVGPPPSDTRDNLEDAWTRWAQAEQKKR